MEDKKKIKGFFSDIDVGDNVEEIKASHNSFKEWVQDPNGYLLIRINREKKEIEVGFCTNDNVLRKKVIGKHPEEIYYTILRENLISSLQHAAYLGRELEKAYLAMNLNKEYVQDSDLEL